MRRVFLPFVLAAVVVAQCSSAWAEPVFVNGLVFPGNTLAATRQPGANGGRLGFFSDIYYDPNRDEWWAVSDRGPGGGVLDYATRVQRFTIDVHPLPSRPDTTELFAVPIQFRPDRRRVALDVAVERLAATIRAMEPKGVSIEHIYDY